MVMYESIQVTVLDSILSLSTGIEETFVKPACYMQETFVLTLALQTKLEGKT